MKDSEDPHLILDTKKCSPLGEKYKISILSIPSSGLYPLCARFSFKSQNHGAKKKKRSVLEGSKIHDQAPDTTNCWKLFEDCLKNIVFEDDRKVVRVTASKEWAEENAIVCNIESIQEIWKTKGKVNGRID